MLKARKFKVKVPAGAVPDESPFSGLPIGHLLMLSSCSKKYRERKEANTVSVLIKVQILFMRALFSGPNYLLDTRHNGC